ncbi:MAG: hypothetical protein K6E86_04590 [Bacteroidales bacterium]|nr:hypothetical protein [Bacteroidales bacterium]
MKNLDEIKFDGKKRTQAGMSVPDGFFEQFQQQLEAKIDTLEAVKQSPVIPMPQQSNTRRLMRWAVAACAVVVISIGALTYFQMQDDSSVIPAPQTAAIEQAVDSVEEEYNMEDMVMRSVNDFELYELYCNL